MSSQIENECYGVIICTADSSPEAVKDRKFKTKDEAAAYVKGFEDAKEQIEMGLSDGEFDQLEEYYAEICVRKDHAFIPIELTAPSAEKEME
jgi:hypothetical protein